MATRSRESRGSAGGEWGYVGGIALSAMLHAGLLYLALFVLPKFLNNRSAASPPTYTVKIVDSIPAGDLGTHLPALSRSSQAQLKSSGEVAPTPPAVAKQEPEAAEPPRPEADKNAIALNDLPSSTPMSTPAPIATLKPTPVPTAEPTPAPTEKPMPTPKPTPKMTGAPNLAPAASKPGKRIASSQPKAHPKPSAAVQLAKAEPTPSVSDQLAKIRKQLLAQHLADQKKHADNDDNDEDRGDTGTTPNEQDKSSGGPAVSAGAGFGIGAGTGSAGSLENLDFLLYYRTVQERVRKAWNFSGGSPDLTATVTFSIGADGSLTAVKVTQSSKDSAYDDSVVRAIRRAAPFPPPPEKYRDQFGGGIEALFKLGEMTS